MTPTRKDLFTLGLCLVVLVTLVSVMAWRLPATPADEPAPSSEPAETAVVPSTIWQGLVADRELLVLVPPEGFVVELDAWRRLWRGWRGDEPLPSIDFERQLAVLATAPGPNRVNLRLSLAPPGDLRLHARSTRKGGPGFGYTLAVVERAGVYAVDGEPLLENEAAGLP